jgi:hypothetical protein
MPEDLPALQVLTAYLHARIAHLRREETGALSLEWVAVIIAALAIVTTVVAVIRAKATAGANRITIP